MKKNLITVLKKLLTTFGGNSETVKNNAVDIIDKIADSVEQSSSSGDGRAEPVVITITATGETSGTWSGATWEELVHAFQHNVASYTDNAMGGTITPITYCNLDNGQIHELLSDNIRVSNQGVQLITIVFKQNHTVLVFPSTYPAT